jgi:hypothetical protein
VLPPDRFHHAKALAAVEIKADVRIHGHC